MADKADIVFAGLFCCVLTFIGGGNFEDKYDYFGSSNNPKNIELIIENKDLRKISYIESDKFYEINSSHQSKSNQDNVSCEEMIPTVYPEISKSELVQSEEIIRVGDLSLEKRYYTLRNIQSKEDRENFLCIISFENGNMEIKEMVSSIEIRDKKSPQDE